MKRVAGIVGSLLAAALAANAGWAAGPLQGWTRKTEYSGEITVKGYPDARTNCPQGCAAECSSDDSGTWLNCTYGDGKGRMDFKRPYCDFGGGGRIACAISPGSGRSARFVGYQK